MKPIPLSTVQKLSITFFMIGVLLMVLGICTGTMVGLIILMVAGWIVLIGDIIFIVLFLDVRIAVRGFSKYDLTTVRTVETICVSDPALILIIRYACAYRQLKRLIRSVHKRKVSGASPPGAFFGLYFAVVLCSFV